MNTPLKPPPEFEAKQPQPIKHHATRFAESYAKNPRARPYALEQSEEHWRTAAALSAAIDAERQSADHAQVLAETLEALSGVPYGSNVLKPLPPSPPPEITVPVNPATGRPIANPFEEPDEKRRARLLADLRQNAPELEKHFERLHIAPLTYLAELEAKRKAVAEEKRFIEEYNADTHVANPFRSGDWRGQSRLTREAPMEARICQAEAIPAKLSIENLTLRGQLAKSNPRVSSIVENACKTLKKWRAEEALRQAYAREEERRQAVRYGQILEEERSRGIHGSQPLRPMQEGR
jgi:hypothetical protein